MRIHAAVGLALVLGAAAPAQATQICGWLKETNQPDDVHEFALWLKSDARVEFLYQIGGKGVVTPSGSSHSPSSGTYSLDPGRPESPWHFGTNVEAPATIDIIVELHQKPADIFSDAPTPLLARFAFERSVPESERKAPPVLAKQQCATLKADPGG
jgi:hypothetical protein